MTIPATKLPVDERLVTLAAKIRLTIGKGIKAAIELGSLFLEARELHTSNNAFGDWCSDINVGSMNQKAVYRCMQLAKHFEGVDTGNISLTCLYELAAPKNDDVRDEVVAELLTQETVTVKDVKSHIAAAHGEPEPKPVAPKIAAPASSEPFESRLTPDELLDKVTKLLPAKTRRHLDMNHHPGTALPGPGQLMVLQLHKAIEENVLNLKMPDRKLAADAVANIVALLGEGIEAKYNKAEKVALTDATHAYQSMYSQLLNMFPAESFSIDEMKLHRNQWHPDKANNDQAKLKYKKMFQKIDALVKMREA